MSDERRRHEWLYPDAPSPRRRRFCLRTEDDPALFSQTQALGFCDGPPQAMQYQHACNASMAQQFNLDPQSMVQPSAYDAGTIADLRRQLAERDAMLARYCATIDQQRAQIGELTAERDALVAANEQRERNTKQVVDALEAMKLRFHFDPGPLLYEPCLCTKEPDANIAAERDVRWPLVAVQLPTWREVSDKQDAGLELTELETFILDKEPAGSEDSGWRERLADALEESLNEDRLHRGLATPATEPKTPRSKAAESPPVASGDKPNTGHPAGGRAAFPARALRGGDGIVR